MENPYEAGLGFAVKLDKGDFIGRDALAQVKAEKSKPKKLVMWRLKNPDVQIYGHEPILLDGKYVGYLTSATYGHTLGSGVGMGYATRTDGASVTKKWLEGNTFQLQVGDEMFEVVGSLSSHFDPKSKRVQGDYESADASAPVVVILGEGEAKRE